MGRSRAVGKRCNLEGRACNQRTGALSWCQWECLALAFAISSSSRVRIILQNRPTHLTIFASSPEGEKALSRAMAFLLHASALPPMSSPDGQLSAYRTPDHPYSLFEGLAGTVCAWLDACVLIQDRISPSDKPRRILGIPGLGGGRVHGFL